MAPAFDGRAFARARAKAGLSRAQLAAQVGVAARTLAGWEAGKSLPSAHHRKAAADALGVDALDFHADAASPASLSGLRTRAGLSQRELASALDVPQSTLSRWESGRLAVPTEAQARLADALGVDADEVRGAVSAAPRTSSAPTVGSRESARSRIIGQATAHLIGVVRWEGLGDFAVEPPPSPPWRRVYSPQGVDLGGREDLGDMFDEAASVLLRRGYTAFRTHYEAEVVIDGETVCTLRSQVQPKSDVRLKMLRALFVAFGTGQLVDAPPIPQSIKRAWREQLRAALPGSKWGERLLIVAEPEDTLQWLREQVWPDKPCVAVLTTVPEGQPRAISFHGARAAAFLGPRRFEEVDLDSYEPATLGDVFAKLIGAKTGD